jgi:hypothetical protein
VSSFEGDSNRDGQDGQDENRIADFKFEISNFQYCFPILLILSIPVNSFLA